MSLTQLELDAIRDEFELMVTCTERYKTGQHCVCDDIYEEVSRYCECTASREYTVVLPIPDSFSLANMDKEGNYKDTTFVKNYTGKRVHSMKIIRKVDLVKDIKKCVDNVPLLS